MKPGQFLHINLWNDVGANREDLRQLDETRAKRGDTGCQFASPFTLHLIGYKTWRACHNPSPPVPEERNDEWCEAVPDNNDSEDHGRILNPCNPWLI